MRAAKSVFPYAFEAKVQGEELDSYRGFGERRPMAG
jgi:hypothetical protein